MISHVSGTVDHKDKSFVILEAGGIGYKIYVPASTLDQISGPGDKVKIFTEQVVREDSITLYGFISREERNLFSSLLTVSGVGPKSALAMISGIPLNKLVTAIIQGNADLITSVPGIGSKTAQKIVIDLKEKLAKNYGLKPAQMTAGIPGETSLISDALSALVTLGYSPREAREAIMNSKIDLDSAKSVEEIIKSALMALS